MNGACKKCGAVIEHDRPSTDDAQAMLIYACGTVLFADGSGMEGHCCLSNQIAAKDAEIARLKVECESRKHYQDLDGRAMRMANNELVRRRVEIAALKAELARYTGPLTDEQELTVIVSLTSGISYTPLKVIDAAIRAAREGER